MSVSQSCVEEVFLAVGNAVGCNGACVNFLPQVKILSKRNEYKKRIEKIMETIVFMRLYVYVCTGVPFPQH